MAAGVHVLAYDRMIQTPKLEAYDSFDGSQVGRLQARWLAANLTQSDLRKHGKNILQIWGPADDGNTLLFLSGFVSVFGSVAGRGGPTKLCKTQFNCVYSTFTPYWAPPTAAAEVHSALITLHNKVAGVYSMDDDMAASIYPELKNAGLGGIPLTGQDATADALGRILLHQQGMTVYKPLYEEAYPAAETAVWWLSGNKGLPGYYNKKSTQSVQSNGHRVMSVISPVKTVTLGNVGMPVADGLDTWQGVCSSIDKPVKPYCGLPH